MTGIELDLSTLSVVFISYDEPNHAENLARLREVAPGALHVHGVKGFDSAHRKAGEVAKTDFVITVDGDNWVTDPEAFSRRLLFRPTELEAVISFAARLPHNGLAYGNGGVKIWPRDMLRRLASHELAPAARSGIDFAWQIPYVQARGILSETRVTATPFQAFRAGLREGVRLTMDGGRTARDAFPDRPPGDALRTHLPKTVIHRLTVWCSVGRRVENGLWAIFGARLGAALAMLRPLDLRNLADFDWIQTTWEQEVSPLIRDDAALRRHTAALGREVSEGLDLPISDDPDCHFQPPKGVSPTQRTLGLLLPGGPVAPRKPALSLSAPPEPEAPDPEP